VCIKHEKPSSFDGCCLADPTHHASSLVNASVTSEAMKIQNYPWSLWFLAFVLFSVDLWVSFSIVEGQLGEMLHGTKEVAFALSCLVFSCLVSRHVVSCLVLSCLVLACLILSCLILCGVVLPYLVLSCLLYFPVLSCLVWSGLASWCCLVLSGVFLSCLNESCLNEGCALMTFISHRRSICDWSS
jgi:hypothetical protein